jgi:hypothetical protein
MQDPSVDPQPYEAADNTGVELRTMHHQNDPNQEDPKIHAAEDEQRQAYVPYD